jgi:methyl-coenzyme M reductase subunit D
MTSTKSEPIPLPEVLIFPHRLLSAETTEKLLNRIYKVGHVRQVNVSGEGLPSKVSSGPHTGLPVDHPQRKVINVNGKEVELQLQVGRVFVEIDDIDNLQGALDEIEKICQEILTFGFNLEVGRYSKYKPTLTDYRKGKRC